MRTLSCEKFNLKASLFNHPTIRTIGTWLFFWIAISVSGAAWCETSTKKRVAFIGDSMAEGYWDGVARLVDQNSCLKAHLEILRFSKDSTGLLRQTRLDWPAELRRIDARLKPDIFVMSIGANDFDPDAKYRDRITAVLDSLVKGNAALLWVGLPAMRAAASDRDARAKNKLYEEVISGYGSTRIEYIKPWKSKDTEEDKFTSYGPDNNKHVVQIRTTDGTHFTFAGNLLTGIYLLPKILARMEVDGKPLCEKKSEAQAR